jgi:hypothetical protein
MNRISLLLLSVTVLSSCAKAHVSPKPVEPPPTFEIQVGELRAFADYRSICVQALEQETRVDLTAVAVSVLTQQLPGFSNNCGAPLEGGLVVTFHAGHSRPRFGLGHVGRNESKRGFVAEADVRVPTCGKREECIQKVAMLFANFIKSANTAEPPQLATSDLFWSVFTATPARPTHLAIGS